MTKERLKEIEAISDACYGNDFYKIERANLASALNELIEEVRRLEEENRELLIECLEGARDEGRISSERYEEERKKLSAHT